jgi:hypothetical protein
MRREFIVMLVIIGVIATTLFFSVGNSEACCHPTKTPTATKIATSTYTSTALPTNTETATYEPTSTETSTPEPSETSTSTWTTEPSNTPETPSPTPPRKKNPTETPTPYQSKTSTPITITVTDTLIPSETVTLICPPCPDCPECEICVTPTDVCIIVESQTIEKTVEIPNYYLLLILGLLVSILLITVVIWLRV